MKSGIVTACALLLSSLGATMARRRRNHRSVDPGHRAGLSRTGAAIREGHRPHRQDRLHRHARRQEAHRRRRDVRSADHVEPGHRRLHRRSARWRAAAASTSPNPASASASRPARPSPTSPPPRRSRRRCWRPNRSAIRPAQAASTSWICSRVSASPIRSSRSSSRRRPASSSAPSSPAAKWRSASSRSARCRISPASIMSARCRPTSRR